MKLLEEVLCPHAFKGLATTSNHGVADQGALTLKSGDGLRIVCTAATGLLAVLELKEPAIGLFHNLCMCRGGHDLTRAGPTGDENSVTGLT